MHFMKFLFILLARSAASQVAAMVLIPRISTLTIHSVVNDTRILPPKAPTEVEDELLFADDPWIDSPIKVDYGVNLRYMKYIRI
jgi:hypothetical protein